jgi:hypothetical protein
MPPGLFSELYILGREKDKLDNALQLVTGLQFSAEADRPDVVAGEDLTVHILSTCRMGISCSFSKPEFSYTQSVETMNPAANQKEGAEKTSEFSEVLAFGKAKGRPPIVGTQPCTGHFEQFDSSELRPEPAPLLAVGREIKIDGSIFCPVTPVTHTTATSTSVTRVPLRLVPAYTLAVEPSQAIEVLAAKHKPFDVFLRVHSYSTKSARVSVGLDTPDGFTSSAPVELSFDGVGDQYAKLTVTPPAKLAPGNFTIAAYAKRGDEKFSTSLEPLPTMPSILWSEPAQTLVHAFDITVPANLRVGYISAEGEMIPEALKRLGINVEMLDANALTFGDLSKYTAIVVGVRAYELRPELASANKRLLDYVSGGGTLVVQYNRDFIWNKFLPAPYHATIGNPTPRITDETAEVKFLKPDDPLLNTPNKITAADFENWVQERGLYYWSDFDAKYTPLLSMHDPGEKDLNGGLVYTHLGKGVYIYTGLAFFRELPEGVPGAYRLFVNLLSASQTAH